MCQDDKYFSVFNELYKSILIERIGASNAFHSQQRAKLKLNQETEPRSGFFEGWIVN